MVEWTSFQPLILAGYSTVADRLALSCCVDCQDTTSLRGEAAWIEPIEVDCKSKRCRACVPYDRSSGRSPIRNRWAARSSMECLRERPLLLLLLQSCPSAGCPDSGTSSSWPGAGGRVSSTRTASTGVSSSQLEWVLRGFHHSSLRKSGSHDNAVLFSAQSPSASPRNTNPTEAKGPVHWVDVWGLRARGQRIGAERTRISWRFPGCFR